MGEPQLADLVRQAHDGEVLGEALFGHLLATEPEPHRRVMMLAAQLLEEQTKISIAGLAADLGVAVGEAPDQRAAGEKAAEALAAMSWPDRMRAIAGATGAYRSLYEQLASVVPDRDHPALVELLAHERSLNAFATAEADGSDGSLAHLLGALDPEAQSRVEGFTG